MGLTKPCPIQVGLHQGSALSLFSVVAILDKLSKDIRDTVPWYMLFVDNIVLVVESRKEINAKLEEWRVAFEKGCV